MTMTSTAGLRGSCRDLPAGFVNLPGLLVFTLLPAFWSGCNPPQREDPVVHVPPQELDSGPYIPPTAEYERELSPCETDREKAEGCFAGAYNLAGGPRISFIANTASSVAADTRPPPDRDPAAQKPETRSDGGVTVVMTVEGDATAGHGRPDDADSPSRSLVPTSEGVGLPEPERLAVPVDRAAVEDHFIDVFTQLAPNVRIVDLGVAREQLERELRALGAGQSDAFLERLRDRNLVDVAVMFDVRILRRGYSSYHESHITAEINSPRGSVRGSAEGTISSAPIFTIALSARAININDGRVLAAVTPPREEVVGETEFGNVLREFCECGAASLAAKMCTRLSGGEGARASATIRVLHAPDNAFVLEFMDWTENEFPGSTAVFRSFSAGQGEFTVELTAGIADLIQRAQRDRQRLRLDAARSGEHTITFVVLDK